MNYLRSPFGGEGDGIEREDRYEGEDGFDGEVSSEGKDDGKRNVER